MAASAGGQALLAVAYIVAARGVSPASFGLVASGIAIGLALIGLIDFGANTLWVRSLANGSMSLAQAGQRALWKCIAATALALLATMIVAFGPFPLELSAVGPVLLATTLAQLSQVPPRAIARSDLTALSIGVSRALSFAILIILISFGIGATTALVISICAGSILEGSINIFLTPRGHWYRLMSVRPVNPWRGSTHFGVYAIATSAQSLDVPILGVTAGAASSGIYAAVNRWTQPLGLAVGGFTSASAPFVASAVTFGEAWTKIRRASWLLALALFGCVTAAALAPIFVPTLLGDQYTGAVPVFQIMALGTIPALLNQPLAVFSQMRGSDKPVGVITAAGVFARLALTAALGLTTGVLGAAIAYSVAQVALLAALTAVFIKTLKAE